MTPDEVREEEIKREYQKALKIVCKNIREDKDLYYGYQSNIACIFMDVLENAGHKLASFASSICILRNFLAAVFAKKFLNMLIEEAKEANP